MIGRTYYMCYVCLHNRTKQARHVCIVYYHVARENRLLVLYDVGRRLTESCRHVLVPGTGQTLFEN